MAEVKRATDNAPERVQTEDVHYVVQVVNGVLTVHSEADSAEGGARVARSVGGFVVSGKRQKVDD